MSDPAPPTLDLAPTLAPTLILDPSPPQETLHRSGTTLAVAVFCTVGLLAGLLLVPLSLASDLLQTRSERIDWLTQLRQWWPQVGAEHVPLAPDPPEAAPAAAAPAAVDPFQTPALAALKGQYCFNFMPGGDHPAARQAFATLVWNKLDADLRATLKERTDVCSPFVAVNEEVISASGCKQHDCGSNDVRFFINTEGKGAVAYRIDDQCRQASEEGFTQTDLLCR